MQAEAGTEEAPAGLKAVVDDAIAACDGDLRATVRARVVTLDAYEAEVAALRKEVASLRVVISPGYVRGRLVRKEAGDDA